jgi:hypothetical protein
MTPVPEDLSVTFDYVAIIDLFSDEERAKADVATQFQKFLLVHKLESKLAVCETADVLQLHLENFARRARLGERFLLHVFGHGSDEGLLINTAGERVSWSALAALLTPLNAAMDGQLVINLSSCEGAYAIRAIAVGDPFFGIIGPSDDTSAVLSTVVNAEFYRTLMATGSIPASVTSVNAYLGREALSAITATGTRVALAERAAALAKTREHAKRGGPSQ